MTDPIKGRRQFLKRGASLLGAAWMGHEGLKLAKGRRFDDIGEQSLVMRGDAPEVPDNFSRPALFAEPHANGIRCNLCPHRCVLNEGDRGFCRARAVRGGKLYTLSYGNLCALAIDPIEKKPLYHFLPQTEILSVATGGCNLRCPNCQNWQISQKRPEDVLMHGMTPHELVTMAVNAKYPSIAFTYTEPMVCYEYVRDTCKLARDNGIKTVLVTAGYIEHEPLAQLAPHVDAMQLDVKSFDDRTYARMVRGRLAPVLRTLEVMRNAGVWVEVSYLLVTQMTDDIEQVAALSHWIIEHLGQETPLHLLRFFPQHRLTHLLPTPIATIEAAQQKAKQAGLWHVYLGNVPSLAAGRTACGNCGQILLERRGYHVLANRLRNGACPGCGNKLSGVFTA